MKQKITKHKNSFKGVKKKKTTPNENGNGYDVTNKLTKCDVCATAAIGYCRLRPSSCGDKFVRDVYVSLSSGQILDTHPDGRVGRKR